MVVMKLAVCSKVVAVCALLAGCGEFRGIPSHGGGKRFDEEQRVVAGAIRQTLADVELDELRGKKVLLSIEAIATDGGGNVTFPGINAISGGVSGNIGEGNLVQVVPAADPGGTGYLKNANTNNNLGGNVGIGYSPQTVYTSAAMSSLPDLAYFRAALEMKARHAGLKVVPLTAPAEAEIVLYVLVDVLGTNRSRSDRIIATNERLAASCECTYYAQDVKTGEMVFDARRVSAEGVYNEDRYFGDKDAHVSRALFRTEPTRLPIDEPEKPTTRPTDPLEVIVDTRD